MQRALAPAPALEYLLYVPRSAKPGAPLMVTVHGISGNALEHSIAFAEMCDECGVVMVAPTFEPHHDYQRLGRSGRGHRVDLLLDRCLAEVASRCNADASRIYLFGFSGGAQFGHRYAIAHPHRVARAVVAAAGWYTFPDPSESYPYGIRPVRALPDVTFDAEQFLRVPISVLVGDLDTTLENTRNTARTNAQQGTTRLERARNWVAAMRDAATTSRLVPRVTLTEVRGVGHSFATFCDQGALVQLVRRFLFGGRSL
ncbi:MAG TPA: hypothetical protein VKD28_00010 [Gemmatimonadales bacterium]|nr:hypothetical protein [Gemmatimonadales bacterium]